MSAKDVSSKKQKKTLLNVWSYLTSADELVLCVHNGLQKPEILQIYRIHMYIGSELIRDRSILCRYRNRKEEPEIEIE